MRDLRADGDVPLVWHEVGHDRFKRIRKWRCSDRPILTQPIQEEIDMLKRILLVVAVLAKLTGVAMLHQSMAVADDCGPCPEPCWPGYPCDS